MALRMQPPEYYPTPTSTSLSCPALGCHGIHPCSFPSPHLSRPSLDARSLMGEKGCALGGGGVPLDFRQKAFSRGTKPKANRYEKVGAGFQYPLPREAPHPHQVMSPVTGGLPTKAQMLSGQGNSHDTPKETGAPRSRHKTS